ncbi:type II secretion system F family protein [Amphibiibacter pelophylacis]|uniref:Type II secretion system F family protein n=1 Tax=Amphibiibacter pelophylacis TaxID=1799477 RepID=A0ACC6P3Y3_9BURK
MATAKTASVPIFEWEAKDRNGKTARGEMRAATDAVVSASLRRQGLNVVKVKKRRMSRMGSIKSKELTVFTRQMATMVRSGVPLLQAFDIVGRGSANPRLGSLINDIRMDIETGTSLSQAFRKHPKYFDALYCNLLEAGETAGILDTVLDRLAIYQEKSQALKSKIKSALMYPVVVLLVAFIVLAVILIKVVPAFKDVFTSFGADLPAPTLFVIAMSEFFVAWWWAIFGGLIGGGFLLYNAWKKSESLQYAADRALLKLPVFGDLVYKSVVARWTRTLSTMFAAGVPLVEALESVGGASGNAVFIKATKGIREEVATGMPLASSMMASNVFPNMVLQMASIGEEAGSLDSMLSKSADFYEEEVDDMVKGLTALMEPIIIVILGGMIGGIVVAMYLPIFKLGAVV